MARKQPIRIKFSKRELEQLERPADGSRITYHDTKEPGLQLRLSPSGRKTFCVFRRSKNGAPERVTVGTFPDVTVEQARIRASQIKNAIASGESPASQLRDQRKEPTLGQAFERYLDRHARPEGLKTADAMRGNFERYLGALPDLPVKKHGRARVKSPGSVNWQNKKLSAIKPTHVVHLRASLAQEAGKAAANHALKLLHVIYNKMIEWGEYCGSNPAENVSVLKIRSRDRFLQKDELPKLFQVLATTDNHIIRDYILLSILTGARKSNVLAMRWDQINFDRREWRIPDTKNNEPVIVQLPEQAMTILHERRVNEGEWVFPGSGMSGHLQSPKKGVQSILDQAGIADLRIHDLRRTLGSWQAITGASLAIIGKSLGHKSTAATMIYARLSTDPVRESVERATAAMLGAAKTDGTSPIINLLKRTS